MAQFAQAPKLPADEMTMTSRVFRPVLTLEADSNLVEVPVVVRDYDDKALADLTAADFTLRVDGKPQTVDAFSVERKAAAPAEVARIEPVAAAAGPTAVPEPPAKVKPRSVAFYFDDLNSNTFDLGSARQMAQKYLANGLEPGQRIAIYTHTGEDTLDLSTDLGKVKNLLVRIQPHPEIAVAGPCAVKPSLLYDYLVLRDNEAKVQINKEAARHYCGLGGASLEDQWDAYVRQSQATLDALHAIINYLARQPGERTIIVSSAAVMTQPLGPQLRSLTDAAVRAHVVIDTVDAKGLVAAEAGMNDTWVGREVWWDNDGMEALADDTGGRFYHDRNDLDRAYREFANTPETSYLLSFTPVVKADGAFHKVEVKVKAPVPVTIQNRDGFFAPAPAGTAAASLSLQTELDQETFANDALSAIPAVVRPVPSPGGLLAAIAVDPHGLAFTHAEGRETDTVTFVAALLDDKNKFVTGQQGTMSLRLKSGTLAAISKPNTGINTGLDLKAPAGNYKLRVMIEESGQGYLTTMTQALTLPLR